MLPDLAQQGYGSACVLAVVMSALGRLHGGGVGVTVVGSKVSARELVMRLAATLSGSPRKARSSFAGTAAVPAAAL